jgi:hypothetical protein
MKKPIMNRVGATTGVDGPRRLAVAIHVTPQVPMKTIDVRIPHTLSQEELRRRLDDGLAQARSAYGDSVGPIESRWEGETLHLGLSVMGMALEGRVEMHPGEVVVHLQLPPLAAMFAGRIREGIEERIGGLLTAT